jgi:flavin-dependent dehydrogenase
MKRSTADVAVIGAGPAGCVFAARMAALGFDVCLIERARFPRAHLGESLSPGVLPMLASAGMAGAVERAGFRRVHEVSSSWEGVEATRRDPHGQGLLVDRGAFDAALLAAVAARVRVLQPALARVRTRRPDGWELLVEQGGQTAELACGFLADASGRAARLGGRRRAMGPRTMALHAYWAGSGLPVQPRIEAGAQAWYWGVPLPDGSYNTLVFVDEARLRDQRGTPLEARLARWLAESQLLRGAQATMRGPARAADATPYLYEDCVGARHVRIGDAALALDPLSSSGMQKAVQTALSGAIVANTLLRRPEDGAAARRYYQDNLAEAAARHQTWARQHYAAAQRTDTFWTARAATGPAAAPAMPRQPLPDDVPLRLSLDCRWDELPCLGAEYVEVKPALRHPSVEGALAYLGGHELAPLLRLVRPGMTSHQIAGTWSPALPFDTGLSIARWLAARAVLERHTSELP